MTVERREAGAEADGRPMTGTYLGAVVLEVITLVALWLFQRYFGA